MASIVLSFVGNQYPYSELIKTLRELLKLINSPTEENPFDVLNSHIYLLLDNHLRG
jgi:hypothetical protein